MRSYYRLFLYLLILCTVILFFSAKDERMYVNENDEIPPSPESVFQDIDLYFISHNGLVKEERHIKRSAGNREQDVLNELKAGSVNEELLSPIDKYTNIISIEINLGTCYINFDSDFIDSDIWQTIPNEYVVYSIVNSITQLDGIDRVQMLIDGDKVKSIGNVRVLKPLAFNKKILVENTLSYISVIKNFIDSIQNRYLVKAYGMMSSRYKEYTSLQEFQEYARNMSSELSGYEIVEYSAREQDDEIIIYTRLINPRIPDKDITLDWIVTEEDDDIRLYFDRGTSYID